VSTRLALVLGRLFDGLIAIGVSRPGALEIVTKVAFDSMPALRKQVFQLLIVEPNGAEVATLSARLRLPLSTVRRVLEDLQAHRVLTRYRDGKGDLWAISDWASALYRSALGDEATVPEKSGNDETHRSRNVGEGL
jgi:hypothetical protein